MDMNLLLLVVLAVMVVLMFVSSRRNAKKRQEAETERRQKMLPGARVMTRSGLFGTLVEFDADDLTTPAKVEIAPGVVVELHAQAIDLAPETAQDTPAAAAANEAPTVGDDAARPSTDQADGSGYTLNGEQVDKLRRDDDSK